MESECTLAKFGYSFFIHILLEYCYLLCHGFSPVGAVSEVVIDRI